MDSIKKKMAVLREKLEAAEERSRKSEEELHTSSKKATEVTITKKFWLIIVPTNY